MTQRNLVPDNMKTYNIKNQSVNRYSQFVMKTIGFVCEGLRDSDMLEAVVRHILNEEIYPLYLQLESSLTGENGCGWKGVWTWCVKNLSLKCVETGMLLKCDVHDYTGTL